MPDLEAGRASSGLRHVQHGFFSHGCLAVYVKPQAARVAAHGKLGQRPAAADHHSPEEALPGRWHAQLLVHPRLDVRYERARRKLHHDCGAHEGRDGHCDGSHAGRPATHRTARRACSSATVPTGKRGLAARHALAISLAGAPRRRLGPRAPPHDLECATTARQQTACYSYGNPDIIELTASATHAPAPPLRNGDKFEAKTPQLQILRSSSLAT